MKNSILDRIMELGANWADGDRAWVGSKLSTSQQCVLASNEHNQQVKE